MHEEFEDIFFSPSTEEESGEIDITDLPTKSASLSGVPSSPTESDESEDTKTKSTPTDFIKLQSIPLLVENPAAPLLHTPLVNSVPLQTTSLPSVTFPYTAPGTSTYIPNMDHLSQYLLNQYICQQVLSSRFNAFNHPVSNLNTAAAMQLGRNLFYNPLNQMQLLSMQLQNPMQIPVSVPVQFPILPMTGFPVYDPNHQNLQAGPVQNGSPVKNTGFYVAANTVSGNTNGINGNMVNGNVVNGNLVSSGNGNVLSGKTNVVNGISGNVNGNSGNGNAVSSNGNVANANVVQDSSGNETGNNTRKRRASSKRPTRRVRPKVIPEKGSIQCKGTNRKKNKPCRNAALMEFIGPRPIYCAEHIQLDPHCLYTKCKSTYQKVPGDKKGCREVVLKEFGLCHKHYNDAVKKMKGPEGVQMVIEKLVRVSELLNNLEEEALKAKKTDADLFQRKNKLIPKFHEIRSILKKRLCELYAEGYFVQPLIPETYLQDTESIIPLSILHSIHKPTPTNDMVPVETLSSEQKEMSREVANSPVPVIEKALEL
jgi:hypothetical protein